MMTEKQLKEKAEELIQASSCCPEAKSAAEKWIASIGTMEEGEARQNLKKELSEDVNSIDGYLAFAGGPAVQIFGTDKAEEMQKNGEKAKQMGEKYCLCDACQAGAVLLRNL